MTKFAQPFAVLATALASILYVAPAHALLSRTCVSAATGNDANAANSCDCSTPCRTFQTAHNNTADQGELTVLDPGGYGALTVTKSISVVNDGGGEASMLVSGGGTGITINASAAGGYVNLRGLTVQGVSGGTSTGLRFNTGISLTMENCVIRNHTGNGIEFYPNASSQISVSSTLLSDNGGHGIHIQPVAASAVKALFNRVEAYGNSQDGILVAAALNSVAIKATAVDTVAANNGGSGFLATGGFAGGINLMVARSVAANNSGTGIAALGLGAHVRVTRSTVTGNGQGWQAANAFLESYGDNNVDGNTPDGSASGSLSTK